MGKPQWPAARPKDLTERAVAAFERAVAAFERIADNPRGGGDAASLVRIENKLDALGRQEDASTARENRIMAFTEDVLSKIAEQTTRLGSIDTSLEALVANGTISQADKDKIMTAFGTTDEQLARAEAALAANVPPTP